MLDDLLFRIEELRKTDKYGIVETIDQSWRKFIEIFGSDPDEVDLTNIILKISRDNGLSYRNAVKSKNKSEQIRCEKIMDMIDYILTGYNLSKQDNK